MRRVEGLRRACLTAALLALAGACSRRPPAKTAAHSPLFTGHEARRRVLLTFPSGHRPGFVNIQVPIYATSSMVAQAKQVLLDLMAGPPDSASGAVGCFGPNAAYNEVYLDGQGLAVVDLPQATVDGLPGGTSAEVATLYCLVRTLCADIPGVTRVQVLIDGRAAETLRGHFDLSDPLAPSDF